MVEFDKSKEKELLKSLKRSRSRIDKHYAYIELQNFYYKYRNLDSKYLDLCEEYCLEDFDVLGASNQSCSSKHRSIISRFISFEDSIPSDLAEILDIKKSGFDCRIPAFERMAIIEEKRGNYDKAISYCDMAIKWYKARKVKEYVEDFEKRKKKLLAKIEKESR